MIEKLDQIFSQYIRKRDCPGGTGRCISCDKVIYFSTCDAGHYIDRRHLSLRFDERNVNAQCIECNRFKNGNLRGYKIGLIEKYGKEIIPQLEQEKRVITKYSDRDIKELIKFYKDKIKRQNDNIKR